MTSPKVVSIVGARPNFMKLKPLYDRLHNRTEHKIIHTGQHYDFELSEIFFREFNLPKPDYNLDIGPGSPGWQVAEIISKTEKLLKILKPDIALVYGDTNSTFAGAYAALKSEVQIGHIESGLRSFDRTMPEENNRVLTDSISTYLFSPTLAASKNLLRENNQGKNFQTGDLSVELVKQSIRSAEKSPVLNQLDLDKKEYMLFTMHRAENTHHQSTFNSILKVFEGLQEKRFVFPIHPRTRKIIESLGMYEKLIGLANVTVIPPLGYLDFIQLAKNARKVITDSGGLQKEAYLLGVPCITIRKNTEWTETIEEDWNILTDTEPLAIIKAISNWMPSKNQQKPIFGDGNTSNRISNILIDILE